MAVLVLQALAVQRGAAGRAPHHEALGPLIGGGPDQVADALKAEHRVKDEERNHADSVRAIRRSGGNERRHRAGFGDPFLEDLPVLRLAIVQHRLGIDRLVQLAGVGVNAALPEQRFHAEGARLVRHDGHDVACRSPCRAATGRTSARRPSWSKPRDRRSIRTIRGTPPCAESPAAGIPFAALARSPPVPCAARAGIASRGCLPAACRRGPVATSSSEIGMPKRVRNSRSSTSLSFFC